MTKANQSADPQAEAAIRLVAWVSGGRLHPELGDFAMLRLALLALLPQIGGMLLMIRRCSETAGSRQISMRRTMRGHSSRPSKKPKRHRECGGIDGRTAFINP
jgi:hypothetical protein